MPRPAGLFDSFDNLDTISAEALAVFLKPVPQVIQIQNYLANKILYPQSIAQTEYEMQIDLAILREALKINASSEKNSLLSGNNPFINSTLRKIQIPARFLDFVPNLARLSAVFIDAFLSERQKKDFFSDLWTVVLTDNADEIVGSVLLPQFNNGGVMNLKISGKDYKIEKGNFSVIPCTKERCEISYKIQNGTFLGRTESAIEISGGKLGLMVDGK